MYPVSKPPLLRLLQYGRQYHQQIILASLASVLNKIFDLAPPALIGTAVDIVVRRQESILGAFGARGVPMQLWVLAAISLAIWAMESAFEYAYARLWRNLAQSMQHDLRLDAYAHLQKLELAFFEERSTGELMSILSDDINQLERFLDGGASAILQVLTTILVVGGAFFILAPQVAWLAMLPMPFIVAGAIWFQQLLAPKYAEVREKVSFLNGRLATNLAGISTIKSFSTEDYEKQRVAFESEAYRQSNRRAIALSAAFIPLIRAFIFVGFTATMLIGGNEVAAGRLAVGTYSSLVFMTQSLLWPLTRLGETFDQYQRAMASTQRVLNLLDRPLGIDDISVTASQTEAAIVGEVYLEDISFAYRDRPPVIQHLSLHVPAGKTTAIVGATGSGKSTLVKLLLRLYEVQMGRILLDDRDIRHFSLGNLRSHIGWVSQDVFLFHGTVAENIRYGSFAATTASIQAAARSAEAHDFIMELPQGYDTIVGERGQKLSGGQRQRLAIARAILRDPPILILDEATSAVDNETEAAILKSLEIVTANRTTIAIAHRLSTIRHAHCIHVMDRGQIVETGTHEALLALGGIYANLWNIQTGESWHQI